MQRKDIIKQYYQDNKERLEKNSSISMQSIT